MAQNAGTIRKLTLGGKVISLPVDVDAKFDRGGTRISEVMKNNDGTTAKNEFYNGSITGITSRVFGSDGTMDFLFDLAESSANGTVISCLVELADGSKWTAGTYVVCKEGPYGTQNAVFEFEIHAHQNSGGVFKKA